MGLIDISLTIQLIIELSFIAIAFWTVEAINFDKIIDKKQLTKKQVLLFLIAICLGHISAQAVFSITNIIIASLNSI